MVPLIIWNPAAGGGRAQQRWRAFERALLDSGRRTESRMTVRPGHATGLASEALAEGYRRIGAFGGDGTLHEVLQGLMADDGARSSGVELVFLPAGTSCDFAKPFPHRASLLERLESRLTRAVDVIHVECHDEHGERVVRYAANSSNIGLVAQATARWNTGGGATGLARRLGVDAGAIAAGLSAIACFQPFECTISVDGKSESTQALSNLTVLKTPWIAGGMRLRVPASPDDGSLTLAVLARVPKPTLLRVMVELYCGTALERREGQWRRAHQVEVCTERRMLVESDGEIIGWTPVRYTIRAAALRVTI